MLLQLRIKLSFLKTGNLYSDRNKTSTKKILNRHVVL